MPKYYGGVFPLPFELVRTTPAQLTLRMLDAVFQSKTDASIALSFQGFETSCLGYVTHVRKVAAGYEILNITGQTELFVTTPDRLISVIRHVSGIEYNEAIQAVFHRARNNIGSKNTPQF